MVSEQPRKMTAASGFLTVLGAPSSFSAGVPPGTTLAPPSLQCSPDFLAGLRGPTSKVRGREREEKG